ncbi:hypothetical protein C8F04DRAFT_1091909 [Mycena alexandri]|uniref:DUF6533 domain-containing protein n=1 Tax=Mycena alexandri TaxID=1745969 RepID=A0AAD6T4G1_9AGAR|nr:hypothetical protein C8F04DRAFT_1091909 [Mycena alexandri]
MSQSLQTSITTLGFQLFDLKLYWVACSALWTYDYLITCGDEVEYAWKGKKTSVFWLFFLNRYLAPCFILITLVGASFNTGWTQCTQCHESLRAEAYFSDAWTLDVCTRYGFMETLETVLLTTTAELFLALRVYAITRQSKVFPCVTVAILTCQWAIAIYAMSQSSQGTDQVALLLPRQLPPLPPLPDIEPYHVCIFISTLTVVPYVKGFLSLSLAFDTLVFLTTVYVTVKSARSYHFIPLMKVIQRDGIMYFLVLFSSNLIWVLLLIYAPPALKFIHNQPAMIISAIMVNRITLNLKVASHTNQVVPWSARTFEGRPLVKNSEDGTELSAFRAAPGVIGGRTSGSGEELAWASESGRVGYNL